MATYEMVIGLEVHVELATKTKIFCGCTTKFGGAPNTHTCPVCTGMPGTLPVANKKVVEFAVAAGLATNCEITRYNKFDRMSMMRMSAELQVYSQRICFGQVVGLMI